MSIQQAIAQTLARDKANLAAQCAIELYRQRPDLSSRYGERGLKKCIDDAELHLRYLCACMYAQSPPLFGDYAGWAGLMLGARGIPIADLQHYFDIMQHTLVQVHGPDAAVVNPYFSAAFAELEEASLRTRAHVEQQHADLASSRAKLFLAALLRRERNQALALITEGLHHGESIQSLYADVLTPVLRCIGWLWQTNQISVAEEHYATATIQVAMSRLYPAVLQTHGGVRRLVATGVAGELHETGLRVLADLFEIEGWHTTYLGSNLPLRDAVQAIASVEPVVVAVGCTFAPHLSEVAALIAELRSLARVPFIMAGGRPFNIDPSIAQRVGADATAPTAAEALSIANAAFETRRGS